MTHFRPRLLIKNGTLIDGSGCDPVPNTLVVVEGNRIAHVGPADGRLRAASVSCFISPNLCAPINPAAYYITITEPMAFAEVP
jgi:hypothetical protein